MSEPIRLYPWSRTGEEQAEDEAHLALLRALIKTLKPGDLIDFDPERVVRADPPSIRSIDGEMKHLGIAD